MKLIPSILLFFVTTEAAFAQNNFQIRSFTCPDTATFSRLMENASKGVFPEKKESSSFECLSPAVSFERLSFYSNNPFDQNKIYLPAYVEGAFCNFEDYINKNRKLRIDFGTD